MNQNGFIIKNTFCEIVQSKKKADELPWQLLQAQEWERLKDCLGNMDMFQMLMTEEKRYELLGYCLTIGNRYDMVEVYNKTLVQYEGRKNQETCTYYLDRTAYFFNLNARYSAAEPLYKRALKIYEKVLGPRHPKTVQCRKNLEHCKG